MEIVILFIGDYSSVHSELCLALRKSGKNVVLMSDGDSYKKLKYDIKVPDIKNYNYNFINKIMNCFRFFGLFGIKDYFYIKKVLNGFSNIEIVQLINPVAIPSLGALGNFLLFRYLRKKAKVISLCALGDDYNWVSACLNKNYKYSAMDRMDRGLNEFLSYINALKYVYSPLYRFLNKYVVENVDLIIPGVKDYEIAYKNEPKLIEIIGLPVSDVNFHLPSATKYPIRIFHAWQRGKENRKGNDVLDNLIKKYISIHGNEKICYEVVGNLSFDQYIQKYKNSDIIFDQIYGYDRGVTAALGMASGKVLFSGFEEGHFEIGVNATPDEDKLYSDFVSLIESVELIDSIKKSAFDFACENYRSDVVSKKYLDAWSRCLK